MYALSVKEKIVFPHKAYHQIQQYDMKFTIKTFNVVREYYEAVEVERKEQ